MASYRARGIASRIWDAEGCRAQQDDPHSAHGPDLTALAGGHGLGVPLGTRRARVRARAAAGSRPLPRVIELRVQRRRWVDQRGRPARAYVQGLLLGRDQEPPWNRGRRSGNVDVAARGRRSSAHGRQPAAAREPQGEEAHRAPAPPGGVPPEGVYALPGGLRLPVARSKLSTAASRRIYVRGCISATRERGVTNGPGSSRRSRGTAPARRSARGPTGRWRRP